MFYPSTDLVEDDSFSLLSVLLNYTTGYQAVILAVKIFFWSLPPYVNQIPLITRADCVYSTPQTLICGLLACQTHDGALGKQKAWTEPSSEGSQLLMKTYTSCMETKQEKKSKAPNSKTQELLQNVEQ